MKYNVELKPQESIDCYYDSIPIQLYVLSRLYEKHFFFLDENL